MRHIGDAAPNLLQVALVRDVLVEDQDFTLLDCPHACDQREERGFADAVRPDHADHDAGGNVDAHVVERNRRAIAVRNGLDPRDRLDGHLESGVLVSAALLSGVFVAGAVACGAALSAAGAAVVLSAGGFGSLT